MEIKPNIFKRIHNWWKLDGRYYHKYFKQGVKNLIYWLPVIWKDRNWDSYYIFELLKHKLKAQANHIGNRDWHTRAQLDAKRMRLCVSLIEKIQEETYNMEYMDYYKDRVWFTDCEGKTNCFQYNSEVVEDNFDEYFKKYPLIYNRVMNGEGMFTLGKKDIKRTIAMNIAYINQDRAHKLLFKIMEKNILGWWD